MPNKLLKSLAITVFTTTLLVFSVNSSFAQDRVKVSSKPVEPFYTQVPANAPKVYEPKVTYLSPEKTAPIEFSSIGATWKQNLPNGTSLLIEVRLKSNGRYSDWYVMEPSIDEKGDHNNQKVSSFLTTNLADGYQYRITLNSVLASQTPVLDDLEFTFINGGSPQERTDLLADSQKDLSPIEENEYLPEDFDSTKITDSPIARTSLVASTSDLTAQAETVLKLPTTTKNKIKTPTQVKKTVKSVSTSKLKVISRADWGADESLRLYTPSDDQKEPDLIKVEDDYYTKFAAELKESKRITTDENGKLLTWPLSYPESIKKIVIHHTATTKDLDDPKKAIRDIYIWHTKSKGWGDIGYNYIIDQQGNIYEGRFGGEMVVGAHAGRGNHGSIGIAILGNYQDEEPSEAVLTSLTALIKAKAEQYSIDTEGASLFRGETYPNVMGHRDIMSTSCPGDKLYAMLPVIRKLAKANLNSTSASTQTISDYDLGWSGGGAPVISFQPKGKKTFTLKLTNTGKKAWPANTYFRVKNSSNAQIFLKGTEILSSTVGKTVEPGSSVEVKIMAVAKSTSGSTLLEIQPVIDGNTILKSLSFGFQVASPKPKAKYDYDLVSIIYSKTDFKKGDTVGVTVKLRNKGTSPWQKSGTNKLMLGTDKPRDHQNKLMLEPSSRLSGLVEDIVQSGQIGTFTFTIKIPSTDGIYKEYFTPVIEGIQWMENHNTFIQIKVGNSDKLMTTTDEDNDGAESISTRPASITSKPASGGSSTNIATDKLDLNSSPRKIRIDLAYRGNPATIASDGDYSLYEGVKKVADFNSSQTASVLYEKDGFKITVSGKTYNISAKPRFVPASGSILRIDNWERKNSSGTVRYNQFRGVLEAIVYDGELHFVNELGLEDYLKGLAEENDKEPVEKIKAMMVIARTYARFYMEVATKFPGAPFDLNDDPQYSQKYLGYGYEKAMPLTASQVSATSGQYVTYQGKLIKTPYFSRSNGKVTISAKDKWGWTDAPFLTSVDDSFCKSTEYAGHGVGLSGCGANALAQMGKNYQEIIKHYYQGTEVTQTNY